MSDNEMLHNGTALYNTRDTSGGNMGSNVAHAGTASDTNTYAEREKYAW